MQYTQPEGKQVLSDLRLGRLNPSLVPVSDQQEMMNPLLVPKLGSNGVPKQG
jgi:hypothetical protein